MGTKIFGWALLIAGILIIAWTLYSSYNMFTGQAAIPEIFQTEEASSQKKEISNSVESQMQEMIGEQLKGLIPADTIPKLFNLTVWAVLAGILIFGGAQISNIGVKLVKK